MRKLIDSGAPGSPSPIAKARAMMPLNPWGFVDQMSISAANFTTTVLLARGLQPASFGAFTLLFSLLLFVVSVQAALITQPHNVIGATRASGEIGSYTTLVAVMQLLFGGAVALVFLAAASIAFVVGWSFALLMLAFVPLVVAWLAQEFVRRVFYTNGEVTHAIRNDLFCYGSQVAGVLILARSGTLTDLTAVAVLTVSSSLGFVAGLYQMRRHWTRIAGWHNVREAILEHWRFGRWLLGGSMLSLTAGGWYFVLTIVGVVAAGAWRALSTILGPLNILTAGLDSLIPPQAARVHASGGKAALRRFLFQVFVFTAPFVAGYCLLVSIFAERIIEVVFGGRYQEYLWLMPLLALSTFLAFTQQPVSLTLRAIGSSSSIFRAQIAAVAVGPPVGILIGYQAGIVGAAVGLIIHFAVLNLVLWTTLLLLMTSCGREPSAALDCNGAKHGLGGNRSTYYLRRTAVRLLAPHGEQN